MSNIIFALAIDTLSESRLHFSCGEFGIEKQRTDRDQSGAVGARKRRLIRREARPCSVMTYPLSSLSVVFIPACFPCFVALDYTLIMPLLFYAVSTHQWTGELGYIQIAFD